MSQHPRSRRSQNTGAALWIACFHPQRLSALHLLPALTDADTPLPRLPHPPAQHMLPLPVQQRTGRRSLCA